MLLLFRPQVTGAPSTEGGVAFGSAISPTATGSHLPADVAFGQHTGPTAQGRS